MYIQPRHSIKPNFGAAKQNVGRNFGPYFIIDTMGLSLTNRSAWVSHFHVLMFGLHFATIGNGHFSGNVPELESHLESQDFALARDHFGMTPLHRAVILNNVASVKFLVNKFPETINARDRVSVYYYYY